MVRTDPALVSQRKGRELLHKWETMLASMSHVYTFPRYSDPATLQLPKEAILAELCIFASPLYCILFFARQAHFSLLYYSIPHKEQHKMYDQLDQPEQFEIELISRSNEPYDPYIPSGSNAGVGPSGQPQGQSNQKVCGGVLQGMKADLAPSFSTTLLESIHTYTNMLAYYDDRSKTFKPKLTRLSM